MKKSLSVFILLLYIVILAHNNCLGQSTYEEFSSLTLYTRDIKVVSVRNPARVVVNNPKIIDIVSVNTEEMVINAKAAGSTDIVWWDDFGEHTLRVDVFAENLASIQERIDAIIRELSISGVFTRREDSEGKIFLLGSVKEEQDKDRLKLALETLKDKIIDLIEVEEEETTVEISVELIEIGKDAQEKLGFTMPSSVSATEEAGRYDGALRGTADALFHVFQWKRDDPFKVTFQALAEQGKVRILSRPRIACQSGKEAQLLVGGEKPIFTTGVVSGGGTSTSVEYKEYGIKLKVKPNVTPEQLIKVGLDVEVSEVQKAETIGGPNNTTAQASPITKRSASTELVLANGQTMVIGGLIKSKLEESTSKVMGLGDIPILGLLFRRKTINRGGSDPGSFGDAELFITLTPRILKNGEASITKDVEPAKTVKVLTGTEETLSVSAAAVQQEDISTLIARYTQKVAQRIKNNLVYPWAASQGQIEGVMRLGLNISTTGELLAVKIIQPSGFAVLDENALRTAKQVAPFSAFPPKIDQEELWIEIPIVYNLKK